MVVVGDRRKKKNDHQISNSSLLEKLSKRYVMILLYSSAIALYFTDKEYSEEVVMYSLHIIVVQYLETNKVQLAGEYHGRTELN